LLILPLAAAQPLAWVGPFAQVTLAIIVLGSVWWRRRSQAAGCRLEISNHPLVAGSKYEACLRQDGSTALESIEVQLVWEEKASYTDGTVTRTDSEQVFHENVYRNAGVLVDADSPLRFVVATPEGAMHSFQSVHNSITWQLEVEEHISGKWANRQKTFPIVVVPPGSVS
jgi:hypothetical protein